MTGKGVHVLAVMADSRKTSFCWFFIVSISLLTSFNLSAQKKIDPGIFAGTSYYMGDLNSSVPFDMPSIAVGPIVRYNLHERGSFRAHAIYHSLKSENLTQIGYYSTTGITNLDASFVDLGLNFEFNWWPYKTAYRRTKMSPYVFVGLGYDLCLTNFAQSHITMPFGFGYKINLGSWLSAGAEIGPRKTFSDRIDGVTNPVVPDVLTPFGNNDWYVFSGVFITYKIFKFWDSCPTYDN